MAGGVGCAAHTTELEKSGCRPAGSALQIALRLGATVEVLRRWYRPPTSGALKSFSIMMLSRSSTSRPVQLSRLSGPHAHGDRSRTGPPLFELKADAPSSVHTQTASCSPMRGWQVLIAIPRPHLRPTAPWRSPLPQDPRGVVDLSGQLLHRSRGHVHRPLPARSLGSSEPGRVQ